MHRLFPPLCMFLALAMAVAGFCICAVEMPQPNIDLHRARVSGDEQYRDALEARLRRQRLGRRVLLGCLFTGSGLLAVTAFLAMRPAGVPR